MSTVDIILFGSLGFSILALAVSIWATISTHRIYRRISQLDEKQWP